jgi:hypothetical protein
VDYTSGCLTGQASPREPGVLHKAASDEVKLVSYTIEMLFVRLKKQPGILDSTCS